MSAAASPPPLQRVRALFPTERSDLRVTWHPEGDQFVVSLWRDGTCVGSAPLSPADAARMAAHVVTELGSRSSWGPRLVGTPPQPTPPSLPQRLLSAVMTRVGRQTPR